MVDKLTGKVVVITGGNGGIGLATAREFKANGPRAVLHGGKSTTYAGVQLRPEDRRDSLSNSSTAPI